MEIEKVLAELGWAQDLMLPMYWNTSVGGRGGTFPVTIELNSATEALFDKIYNIGFKDGVERGAYEQQTQEDAETSTPQRVNVQLSLILKMSREYNLLLKLRNLTQKGQLKLIFDDEEVGASPLYAEEAKEFLLDMYARDMLKIKQELANIGLTLEE